jgi:hypothetical protein
MKRTISFFLLLLITLNQPLFAACEVAKIKKQQDGTYSYPVDCHADYGRLKKVEVEREKQVALLNKTIELKDLALDTSLKRVEIWQKSTYKVEDRLLKFERNSDTMKWIYFGLGILTMSAAVHGASKIK